MNNKFAKKVSKALNNTRDLYKATGNTITDGLFLISLPEDIFKQLKISNKIKETSLNIEEYMKKDKEVFNGKTLKSPTIEDIFMETNYYTPECIYLYLYENLNSIVMLPYLEALCEKRDIYFIKNFNNEEKPSKILFFESKDNSVKGAIFCLSDKLFNTIKEIKTIENCSQS